MVQDLVKNFLFNGIDELGSKTFLDYFPEYQCEDGTVNEKRSIIGKSFEHRTWYAAGEFVVVQTVWKVGKDGVEAGTNLVPDSVPRPIARISVTVAVVTLALFVFKSLLSTAFFVLSMMGLIYLAFMAMNKDDDSRGGGGSGGTTSTDDSLEEARRIMEKYK